MENIRYLAEAYFHQDWTIEAPTPEGVVRCVRSQEVREVVDEIVVDLDIVISSNMTEAQLGKLWVDECNAYYDPARDNIKYRAWFTRVRELLTQA